VEQIQGEILVRLVFARPQNALAWEEEGKPMPVLSVPGALVGGDEVSMAVFHELSRAEGPSQQTGLTADFRQTAPEIHVSHVSP
jgi:hypothetical protein